LNALSARTYQTLKEAIELAYAQVSLEDIRN
jgi:hypothetical protein